MKYHILLRITHWVMGFTIIGLFALGLYMNSLTPEEGRYDLYDWHKAFGMLVILLFFGRIALRATTKVPPLPEGIKPHEKKLSHLVHGLLYLGMIGVPAVGYFYSSFGGHPVPFLGMTVPNIVAENKELSKQLGEVHEILAFILIGCVVLHVLGALKHRFFEPKENDVISRMV